MAQTYQPGDKVTYRHEHRGGYGYETLHPAVVVRSTGKRVTIRVARRDVLTRLFYPIETSVTAARLSPREKVVDVEDVLKGGGQ